MMTAKAAGILKGCAMGGFVTIVVVACVVQFCRYSAKGENGLKVWFYDQSEKRLYPAPRDTIPPDRGVGGEQDDGVRAVVVACRGECEDRTKLRIAYLETYTPELKNALENIREARSHWQVFQGPNPTRSRDYLQKNTLVRREDEAAWHALSSPEGRKIIAQWQSWHCPDGQAVVVCTP